MGEQLAEEHREDERAAGEPPLAASSQPKVAAPGSKNANIAAIAGDFARRALASGSGPAAAAWKQIQCASAIARAFSTPAVAVSEKPMAAVGMSGISGIPFPNQTCAAIVSRKLTISGIAVGIDT